jgi:ABC-type spermidine/putrescine transport system permease subunit I
VVAQQMVTEFFTNRNFGMGAALAVLLFVAVSRSWSSTSKVPSEQEATR